MEHAARITRLAMIGCACVACGGSSTRNARHDSGSEGGAGAPTTEPAEYDGPGAITDGWSGLCTATFSVDYQVMNRAQKPWFTARAGERYLMSTYDAASALLLYLTPLGATTFTVESPAGVGYPFSSSCAFAPASTDFAVFADVTLYAGPELTRPLCDLESGTVDKLDPTKGSSYALISQDADRAVFALMLNVFGERCGAEVGYLAASPIRVLGESQLLVPFGFVLAEK
jgi:hypothetical protein